MNIYIHDPKKTLSENWNFTVILILLILQLDLMDGNGSVNHIMPKENLKMTTAYGRKLLSVV